MKNSGTKKIVAAALASAMIAVPAMSYAAGPSGGMQGGFSAGQQGSFSSGMQFGQTGSSFGFSGTQMSQMGQMGQSASTASFAGSPNEIVTSTLTSNSAESLTVDYTNAETITMSDENSSVTINSAGTYIITGTCSDGNIKVKKGTTGVVLVLKDLDLTSTVGATLSVNKGAEAKIVIEGTVKLTDAESLADEDTDDFDGAVIKAKAGSSTVLTGSGTLYVNGSCKNGIKVSDLDEDDITDGYTDASFIIDGSLTINVTATNDGMNSGTDLTIKSGNINVSAGGDGIKSDYILTIGESGTTGPTINIKKSCEGLEGAVVNIYSGTINITASDDGINAANSDLSGYTFSINIMGGTVNISAGADGLDSNGNINITGGLTTIKSAASNSGDGGIDYEGACYVADGCLVNPYGVTMDSGMGAQMGGMGQPGQMGGQSGQTLPGQSGSASQSSSSSSGSAAAASSSGSAAASSGSANSAAASVSASQTYSDVASSAWYFDAVNYVTKNNYFGGVSADSFAPSALMTRAMFATVLWRMAGQPSASAAAAFSDVEAGKYYEKAAAWASEQGILLGSNGRFNPGSAVTREQLAVLLWRYAGSPSADISVLGSYSDSQQISAYAKQAMAWAVSCGVISGKGSGMLDPQGSAKRSEVAQVVMNYDLNVQ